MRELGTKLFLNKIPLGGARRLIKEMAKAQDRKAH